MATPSNSLRLPAETLDRLRALAVPGESLSGVVLRAALALEAAPTPAPTTDTTDRLGALEARVSRLEACLEPAPQDLPEPAAPVFQAAPSEGTSAAVQDILMMALQQGLAAAQPPPPGRPVYPQEVRQMALAMAERGAPPIAIRRAVEDACGHEPGSKNWSRVFSAWQKAATA